MEARFLNELSRDFKFIELFEKSTRPISCARSKRISRKKLQSGDYVREKTFKGDVYSSFRYKIQRVHDEYERKNRTTIFAAFSEHSDAKTNRETANERSFALSFHRISLKRSKTTLEQLESAYTIVDLWAISRNRQLRLE